MIASFETAQTDVAELVVGSDVISRGVTLAAGQNLRRGSVLGRFTASGKHTLAIASASDGSQTPSAVLAEDCNASGGDTPSLAYFEGTFLEGALTFGAGVNAAYAREPLRTVGINLQSGQAR